MPLHSTFSQCPSDLGCPIREASIEMQRQVDRCLFRKCGPVRVYDLIPAIKIEILSLVVCQQTLVVQPRPEVVDSVRSELLAHAVQREYLAPSCPQDLHSSNFFILTWV